MTMKTLPVLFENSEILIINKPAGIAVQGGEKVFNPVDEILCQQIGQKVFPVHRLDKDTAGILVVAKTSVSAKKWTNIISSGRIKKQYSAICFGFLPQTQKNNSTGTFNFPIEKGQSKKDALTQYKIIDSKIIVTAEEEIHLSFFNLTLGTGRMHQIRIHLAQAGCPIIADDKYGNFKLNRKFKKLFGIKKLQLAATNLEIPIDGKKILFNIPLPEHMENTYAKLFLNK